MLGLDDFHRSHAPSLTAILRFCNSVILQHPHFYLHNPGLPFWCRSMFPIGPLLKTCSQTWKLWRWLCRWLLAGQKLSLQDNPILAFMTSFKNIHLLLKRETLLFPMLTLGKSSCPHRQDSNMCLQYSSNHLQYKSYLQLVSLFLKVYVAMVFILLLCTRVNPTSFSVSLFITPIFKAFSPMAIRVKSLLLSY